MKLTTLFFSTGTLVGAGVFGYMAVQNYDPNHQSDTAPELLRKLTELFYQTAIASAEAGTLGAGAAIIGYIFDRTIDCIKCAKEVHGSKDSDNIHVVDGERQPFLPSTNPSSRP